jgi:glycosyltransferase involved in cell wall biosynthesis
LNNLRYFSNLYFHGHSVGGTNPSLLEAMASHCLIVANDNPFNRSVLEEDAFYFRNTEDIARLLDAGVQKTGYEAFMRSNRQKIERDYSWDHIAGRLLNLFEHAVSNR